MGSGRQYWSWIAIDDAVGAIHHALITDALCGPSNAVAPHPITIREFTKTLGALLSRPTLAPTPEFAARFAFGEMADELLLASARVEPERLRQTGYLSFAKTRFICVFNNLAEPVSQPIFSRSKFGPSLEESLITAS